MVWQDQHDLLLLKEILAQEPGKLKHGSVERGKCWDLIADTLNTWTRDLSAIVLGL